METHAWPRSRVRGTCLQDDDDGLAVTVLRRCASLVSEGGGAEASSRGRSPASPPWAMVQRTAASPPPPPLRGRRASDVKPAPSSSSARRPRVEAAMGSRVHAGAEDSSRGRTPASPPRATVPRTAAWRPRGRRASNVETASALSSAPRPRVEAAMGSRVLAGAFPEHIQNALEVYARLRRAGVVVRVGHVSGRHSASAISAASSIASADRSSASAHGSRVATARPGRAVAVQPPAPAPDGEGFAGGGHFGFTVVQRECVSVSDIFLARADRVDSLARLKLIFQLGPRFWLQQLLRGNGRIPNAWSWLGVVDHRYSFYRLHGDSC